MSKVVAKNVISIWTVSPDTVWCVIETFLHLCVVRLLRIEGHQELLTTELVDLQEKKKQTEQELKTNSILQASTVSV